MHFWIDKRSSQLHNFGGGNRGRVPGPGGFYRGSMGSSGSRRPRSHNSGHSASSGLPGGTGRRRSSSSSGGFNQRRSSVNRWTYDPYNISHHQQSRHSQQAQMWPDGRQGFMDVTSSNNLATSPHGILNVNPDLSESQVRSAVLGTSTTSTGTNSMVDPAWKRTKRIGLTLCFMAFILLSTVAAKFVIEGPWLIDKTPRSERTEATIYFFLTEVIFILFAMGLFFAGVTCLRKRTNAYLLRQFNEYILQTSPHGTGPMGSPNYFGRGTNGEMSGIGIGGPSLQHQAAHTGGMMGMNPNIGGDRPFLGPHYLPSLENHLINMHISVAESSNFVMSGLSKPPPYHIALYLPVPDELCEITTSTGSKEATPEPKPRQPQQHNSQSSSWISSCLVDNEETLKTDEDSADDDDNDGVEGRPRKKRRRDDDHDGRSETPPPPYGQLK
ncbi:uncharacterized protein LOC110858561 isoform X3 [Folsomia candida]|uniref:uncharacterized protein LOC110858561 isoform X3 n=1 Tax=Folsomia candida TaxID=158441 RepID=UPI0016055067|nr:uncharacterized protein LOC110858561 isoform X3 [Folsomia candida]